jgi:hypothetical protein
LERTWSDSTIRRYLGGPLTGDKLASKRASPAGPGDLAVTLHSGEVIGFCTLGRYHTGDVELSFAYLTQYWGKGLAERAVQRSSTGPELSRPPAAASWLGPRPPTSGRGGCLADWAWSKSSTS